MQYADLFIFQFVFIQALFLGEKLVLILLSVVICRGLYIDIKWSLANQIASSALDYTSKFVQSTIRDLTRMALILREKDYILIGPH